MEHTHEQLKETIQKSFESGDFATMRDAQVELGKLQAKEAFEIFTKPEDSAWPLQCHNHCTHYEDGSTCCDCGAERNRPVPIQEFFAEQIGEEEFPGEQQII
jgi:hypothetical protein